MSTLDAERTDLPDADDLHTHSVGTTVKQCTETLLILASFLSFAAMTAGWLGKWHYLLDLASQLRVQATIVMLVSGLILWLLGRKRVGGASLLFGGGLCLSMLPYYWPTDPVTGKTYRLMTANVLTRNTNKAAVLKWIAETDPDFVVLQETNAAWTSAMEQGLHDQYPYRRLMPRDDNFGIAMFSKHRWSKCDVVSFSMETMLPSLVAEFSLPNGEPLRLIATHPLPPMRHSTWSDRNRAFWGIADHAKRYGSQRMIVAGDLNCTPWSYWFRRLLKQSGLRDASLGQGLQSTWNPTSLPLPGMMIDHVLVGAEIKVADRVVGPGIGSDHRPVIVDFR